MPYDGPTRENPLQRGMSRRTLLAGIAGAGAGLGLVATPAAASTGAPGATGPFVIPEGYTSAAVQAAVRKAYQPGNGAVFLPSGRYKFTSQVEVNKPITIMSASDATIDIASGVDGFLFRGYNGNGQRVILPNLSGGARQVRLSGVAVMNLYVGHCTDGDVGIQLETVPSSVSHFGTLDNNVFFQFITRMKYGVQLLSNAPLPRFMQGNVISGNFITDTLHAVDVRATSQHDNITINIFDIAAIDGARRTGSTGITLSGVKDFGSGGNTFKMLSFFGGFDEKIKNSYIDFPSFLNQFYVRPAGPKDYAGLVNLSEGGAPRHLGGNKLVFTQSFGGPLLNRPPVAAVPDMPDRSKFNGGKTVALNSLRLSCAVKELSAGAHQDFYFFTPLLDGYTNNIQATLTDDGGNAYSVSIQDESIFPGSDGRKGPNQVHIKVRSAMHAPATTIVLNVLINP